MESRGASNSKWKSYIGEVIGIDLANEKDFTHPMYESVIESLWSLDCRVENDSGSVAEELEVIDPVRVDRESLYGHSDVYRYGSLEGILSRCNFTSFRSRVGRSSGKWMYEVQLVTAGVMQIGWCTRSCPFRFDHGVGDSPQSYAYDGNRLKKWSVRPTLYGEHWGSGDIIGCCVDLDLRSISFYRNGRSLGLAYTEIEGAGEDFYPAASLSLAESVLVNYGSLPFRYPVEGYQPMQSEPSRPVLMVGGSFFAKLELLYSKWGPEAGIEEDDVLLLTSTLVQRAVREPPSLDIFSPYVLVKNLPLVAMRLVLADVEDSGQDLSQLELWSGLGCIKSARLTLLMKHLLASVNEDIMSLIVCVTISTLALLSMSKLLSEVPLSEEGSVGEGKSVGLTIDTGECLNVHSSPKRTISYPILALNTARQIISADLRIFAMFASGPTFAQDMEYLHCRKAPTVRELGVLIPSRVPERDMLEGDNVVTIEALNEYLALPSASSMLSSLVRSHEKAVFNFDALFLVEHPAEPLLSLSALKFLPRAASSRPYCWPQARGSKFLNWRRKPAVPESSSASVTGKELMLLWIAHLCEKNIGSRKAQAEPGTSQFSVISITFGSIMTYLEQTSVLPVDMPGAFCFGPHRSGKFLPRTSRTGGEISFLRKGIPGREKEKLGGKKDRLLFSSPVTESSFTNDDIADNSMLFDAATFLFFNGYAMQLQLRTSLGERLRLLLESQTNLARSLGEVLPERGSSVVHRRGLPGEPQRPGGTRRGAPAVSSSLPLVGSGAGEAARPDLSVQAQRSRSGLGSPSSANQASLLQLRIQRSAMMTELADALRLASWFDGCHSAKYKSEHLLTFGTNLGVVLRLASNIESAHQGRAVFSFLPEYYLGSFLSVFERLRESGFSTKRVSDKSEDMTLEAKRQARDFVQTLCLLAVEPRIVNPGIRDTTIYLMTMCAADELMKSVLFADDVHLFGPLWPGSRQHPEVSGDVRGLLYVRGTSKEKEGRITSFIDANLEELPSAAAIRSSLAYRLLRSLIQTFEKKFSSVVANSLFSIARISSVFFVEDASINQRALFVTLRVLLHFEREHFSSFLNQLLNFINQLSLEINVLSEKVSEPGPRNNTAESVSNLESFFDVLITYCYVICFVVRAAPERFVPSTIDPDSSDETIDKDVNFRRVVELVLFLAERYANGSLYSKQIDTAATNLRLADRGLADGWNVGVPLDRGRIAEPMMGIVGALSMQLESAASGGGASLQPSSPPTPKSNALPRTSSFKRILRAIVGPKSSARSPSEAPDEGSRTLNDKGASLLADLVVKNLGAEPSVSFLKSFPIPVELSKYWLAKNYFWFVSRLESTLAAKAEETSATAESDLCPICYASATDTTIEPCGHRICHVCLSRQRMNTDRCPFCNELVTGSSADNK